MEPGRNIIDGQKQVRIFGEEIEVKAEIVLVEGMSGHADVDGLERWVGNFKEKPKRVFVVHGSDQVCDTFVREILSKNGFKGDAPFSGAVFDLAEDNGIHETVFRLVKREGGRS
jgi:metallo-beta-lactamase family protein